MSLQRYDKSGKVETRSAIRMKLDGASDHAEVTGEADNGSRSNYFLGNDPSQWRTDVPNYGRVKYGSIYDGIDLVYYGTGQQLEYDFVVRPGHDPKNIKLKFDGVESAKVDEKSGDLILETGAGAIRQLKPFVYQNANGARTEIAST